MLQCCGSCHLLVLLPPLPVLSVDRQLHESQRDLVIAMTALPSHCPATTATAGPATSLLPAAEVAAIALLEALALKFEACAA